MWYIKEIKYILFPMESTVHLFKREGNDVGELFTPAMFVEQGFVAMVLTRVCVQPSHVGTGSRPLSTRDLVALKTSKLGMDTLMCILKEINDTRVAHTINRTAYFTLQYVDAITSIRISRINCLPDWKMIPRSSDFGSIVCFLGHILSRQCRVYKIFAFQPKQDANGCQFRLATAASGNPFNFVNAHCSSVRNAHW